MISTDWYSGQAHCPHSHLAEEFNPWDGAYLDDPYSFSWSSKRPPGARSSA
jgi:hypothetical protein